MRRIDRATYRRQFGFAQKSGAKRKAALKRAWETRNFEIELYWKRATYFWTIIGVLFGGYAILASTQGDHPATTTLACVGFVLSTAWYLVNRGSSAWQRNWEAHVDALEGPVTGPLYKTVYDTSEYRLHHWLGPLAISPSKATIAVSLFITLIWSGLIIYSLPLAWWPFRFPSPGNDALRVFSIAVAALGLFALLRNTGTRPTDSKLRFRRRVVRWD